MSDIPCSRSTKRGKACRLSAMDWTRAAAAGIPDPRSCRIHITLPELEALWAMDAARRQREEEEAEKVYPACWAWPVPSHVLQQVAAAEDAPSESVRLGVLDGVLSAWQDGRCAICGENPSRFVHDHDHGTGYLRGLCCRRCNHAEGFSDEPVFKRYRQRSPAVMLGIRWFYDYPEEPKASIEAVQRHTAERVPEASQW